MMRSERWLLRSPIEGSRLPTEDDFSFETVPVPAPGSGEVLVRAIYLSMDPYMRGRISPARNYSAGVAAGQLMTGRAVAQVIESAHPAYRAGDIVAGELGWQTVGLMREPLLRKVDPALGPISTTLGLLGLPGLTAYFALLELGLPRPGDTVLVSAASGAVGSAVGQIARLAGCRTIGLAGSPAKIAWCRDELGYDEVIDYRREPDLSSAIAKVAPCGVDVFFDNAGGSVHQAVMAHLAVHARVVICGVMSQYNPIAQSQPAVYNLRHILVSRAEVKGFLAHDFEHRFDEGRARLGQWLAEGKLRYRESIVEGIARAPAAFVGLLTGENIGKQLVQLAPVPAGLR
jgi:NADPH-dependent curcumin reductase CurA